MNTPTTTGVTQQCPNCGKVHDVAVFVTGQQIQCNCGIRFEVRRTDVRASMIGTPRSSTAVNVNFETGSPLDRTVASSSPKQPDESGLRPDVPGYSLEHLLGRGGMGEVWRARQLSLDRRVAVKLLPSKFAQDPEFVARFEKETKALAALSHPNIVQIIDRGRAGDHYFFAMELVSGVTLRDILQAPLSARDAMKISAQIARAIDYAHEQKIIHRDLKPENILVDTRGHVKILDFGLAGMQGHERNLSLTATAVAMGTVNYMAPEQRRDAKHVDHRADLYSMGVLIYEMLTGELPLGRFKLPTQKVQGLDPRIDDIVGQLLETDPAARPHRALDVALVLDDLITPSSAPRSAPSNLSVAPPSQQPGKGWKLGALVLAALLATGVVVKLIPSEDQDATPMGKAPDWYEDSDELDLFTTESAEKNSLLLDFEVPAPDAGEMLNPHTGAWAVKNGQLEAIQFGDPVGTSSSLRPRAYLSSRYFTADDFEASVDVDIEPLPSDFPPLDPERTQKFAELAFRIKDLQVSLFAIPGTDMRLGWRYFDRAGQEHSGNSTRDQVDELLEDAFRVPKGQFQVRLKMRTIRNGDVNVEAFVNQRRFARKVLPGLAGQVGKLALGCRNLLCRFDNLKVTGKPAERPLARK